MTDRKDPDGHLYQNWELHYCNFHLFFDTQAFVPHMKFTLFSPEINVNIFRWNSCGKNFYMNSTWNYFTWNSHEKIHINLLHTNFTWNLCELYMKLHINFTSYEFHVNFRWGKLCCIQTHLSENESDTQPRDFDKSFLSRGPSLLNQAVISWMYLVEA